MNLSKDRIFFTLYPGQVNGYESVPHTDQPTCRALFHKQGNEQTAISVSKCEEFIKINDVNSQGVWEDKSRGTWNCLLLMFGRKRNPDFEDDVHGQRVRKMKRLFSRVIVSLDMVIILKRRCEFGALQRWNSSLYKVIWKYSCINHVWYCINKQKYFSFWERKLIIFTYI